MDFVTLEFSRFNPLCFKSRVTTTLGKGSLRKHLSVTRSMQTFTMIIICTPQNKVHAWSSSAGYRFLPASPPHTCKHILSPKVCLPNSISASKTQFKSYFLWDAFPDASQRTTLGSLSPSAPCAPPNSTCATRGCDYLLARQFCPEMLRFSRAGTTS